MGRQIARSHIAAAEPRGRSGDERAPLGHRGCVREEIAVDGSEHPDAPVAADDGIPTAGEERVGLRRVGEAPVEPRPIA
jgi:hypothetical protein